MSSVSVGLARARYSGNFAKSAEEAGVPAHKILDKAGLSENIFDHPEAMTTAWQLGQVTRLSALWTDNLDIGWEAAEAASLEQYGSFSEELFSRDTLYERLLAFCGQARDEYSDADFDVHSHEDKLYFTRGPIAGDELEARQTELYVLSMMLGTIRSVLGQHWRPKQIAVQSFYRPETERYFDTRSTDLRFDQPYTVVVIESTEATRSVDRIVEANFCTHSHDLSSDFLFVLEDLIGSHLSDHRLSLAFIAKICDLQPRTLQRLLKEQGTGFRELVARQRFIAASNFLKETDLPITEISSMLGYAHQAHFGRAFRERTGLSPMAYRRTARA
jgi:AraC-like DNA-binding protein